MATSLEVFFLISINFMQKDNSEDYLKKLFLMEVECVSQTADGKCLKSLLDFFLSYICVL